MGQQLITNYLPPEFDLKKITEFIPPNIDLIIHTNNVGYWIKSKEDLGDSVYAYCKEALGALIWEPEQVQTNTNNDTWTPSWGKVISLVGLNVRPEPNTNKNPIAALGQGQRFHIISKTGNWYQIDKPFTGYIDAQYTKVSQTPQSVSDDLIDFTASWEGFSATPYLDAGGNWTIGFGICSYAQKPNYTMTKSEAREELKNTLNNLAIKIYNLTKNLDLCQSEFDSLVDFSYNLGLGAFEGSDLFANFKECMNSATIAGDFTAWSYCNDRQLEGLVRRRKAEAKMWLTGQYQNN